MRRKPQTAKRDPDNLIAWPNCGGVGGLSEDVDIHPNMPLEYGSALNRMCRAAGVSIWDRRKVYDALKSL